jgi:putative membrane protein
MKPQVQQADAASLDPRVLFAAERTLLAWVRTGLAMMGFGFVVARFGLFMRELIAARGVAPSQRLGLSLWVGTTLVALGVAVNIAAAVQHRQRIRRLARGEPVKPRPLSLATFVAAVLALVGVLMAVYLVRAG